MYGAILRPSNELVECGEAHVGVLHATIALGRFLVDIHDPDIFPRRRERVVDSASQTVEVNLHAPCGIVRLTVPVVVTEKEAKSDPSRPVSFLSPPAYATAINHPVYGGTYYVLVDVRELGFAQGLRDVDFDRVTPVLKTLKGYLNSHPDFPTACRHPSGMPLAYPYSVMVVDTEVGGQPDDVEGAETGLCFFADDQIDRSLTGSCVVARMALAYAKGERRHGQRWACNSLVSNHFSSGAFVEEIVGTAGDAVTVRVEGSAYNKGTSSFIVEEGDVAGHGGFTMKNPRTPAVPGRFTFRS
ncbi:Diaminopimelate epimerase-like protein [Aspergillus heteromorphus CBS 117.55]|uniref:trans-L-3-hydroxyproline dehydratase n=1 Tax=Aspergillus heteromorphus CBS 117.55 TaxID=1448321 RepID=A0A317VIM4_9EURO|nr:Diaminopimelate epimerase-like protein [Aspergillus heteromorphus CBS 117.55]PWY73047.1 Diaminopimelate epimerase-like protein [Aspergillus heteromorphus CBS 117.55]